MSKFKWFEEAKYGMMIHWGLYSLLGGEWKGHRSQPEAEWIMHRARISIGEYEKLAKVFNPIYFNAEEVVLLAKECGMKYIVMTSKHHDGFAMYCPTPMTRHYGWTAFLIMIFSKRSLWEWWKACYLFRRSLL